MADSSPLPLRLFNLRLYFSVWAGECRLVMNIMPISKDCFPLQIIFFSLYFILTNM